MNIRTIAVAAVLVTAGFAATFGGSAAATALITGAQVKNGSVTGADLRNGSLTSTDLRGGLSLADVVPGVSGPVGGEGPVGATGDAGPVGPAGATGRPGIQGISGVGYVVSPARTLGAGQYAELPVNCPGRLRAVHGGVSTQANASFTGIQESAPDNSGTSWVSRAVNEGATMISVQGWAVCVDAG